MMMLLFSRANNLWKGSIRVIYQVQGGEGERGELSVIFLAVKVSFRIANRNGCHTVLVVKTD